MNPSSEAVRLLLRRYRSCSTAAASTDLPLPPIPRTPTRRGPLLVPSSSAARSRPSGSGRSTWFAGSPGHAPAHRRGQLHDESAGLGRNSKIRPIPVIVTGMIIQLVGHNHDLAVCGLRARAACAARTRRKIKPGPRRCSRPSRVNGRTQRKIPDPSELAAELDCARRGTAPLTQTPQLWYNNRQREDRRKTGYPIHPRANVAPLVQPGGNPWR